MDKRRISAHLYRHETACKCGCGFNVADYTTVIMFEQARVFEGNNPVTPNSWCRCKEYNEIIQLQVNPDYLPYSSKSKHLEGIACDYPSKKPLELYNYLDKLYPECCGIGLYDWGVHFDSRSVKARWDTRT